MFSNPAILRTFSALLSQLAMKRAISANCKSISMFSSNGRTAFSYSFLLQTASKIPRRYSSRR